MSEFESVTFWLGWTAVGMVSLVGAMLAWWWVGRDKPMRSRLRTLDPLVLVAVACLLYLIAFSAGQYFIPLMIGQVPNG